MRDMYEFTRDSIKELIDNPIEALLGLAFLSIMVTIFYTALWIVCPC